MATPETNTQEVASNTEMLTILNLGQLKEEINKHQFSAEQRKNVEDFMAAKIGEAGKDGFRVTRENLNKLLADFELHKLELSIPEHLRSVYEAWKKTAQAQALTGVALGAHK
jgi:hypothetical protein